MNEKGKQRIIECDTQGKITELQRQMATYLEMGEAKGVPGDSYCGG